MCKSDYDLWFEEYENINNDLAVPLYRKFCKDYGLNFHFADEKSSLSMDKLTQIRTDEMSLDGKALSLFNYVNKPFHAYKNSIVSFVYTSWVDFDHETLSLSDIASELQNDKEDIAKLEYYYSVYGPISFILTMLFSLLIITKITNSTLLITIAITTIAIACIKLPDIIYDRKKKVELHKFNKKLSELKEQLKSVKEKNSTDEFKGLDK